MWVSIFWAIVIVSVVCGIVGLIANNMAKPDRFPEFNIPRDLGKRSSYATINHREIDDGQTKTT